MTLADFASLDDPRYVNLTTYRKNGVAVRTPIWICLADGKAYHWTSLDSFKAKRLQNNSACALTPCNANGKKDLGPTVQGTARLLPTTDFAAKRALFRKKYGWQGYLFEFINALRRVPQCYFEISPSWARDE